MDSRANSSKQAGHPGQHDDRLAGLDPDDFGRGKVLAEVNFPAREKLGERPRGRHVADVCEALVT